MLRDVLSYVLFIIQYYLRAIAKTIVENAINRVSTDLRYTKYMLTSVAIYTKK